MSGGGLIKNFSLKSALFTIGTPPLSDLVGMNPKAENSCVVRRAKLSKQTASRKSEKQFSKTNRFYRRWVSILHRFAQRTKNFTDGGRRFEFEGRGNKVHERDEYFRNSDKKLTIKTG